MWDKDKEIKNRKSKIKNSQTTEYQSLVAYYLSFISNF